MSEELTLTIPVVFPDAQDTAQTMLQNESAGEVVQISSLQVGTQVQFLKFTISSNGKFHYKETLGSITAVNENIVDVIDCLGDVVQISANFVKVIKTEQPSADAALLSAV